MVVIAKLNKVCGGRAYRNLLENIRTPLYLKYRTKERSGKVSLFWRRLEDSAGE